jgi:SPP1 gp7 family putative phage head morphogenesis protein
MLLSDKKRLQLATPAASTAPANKKDKRAPRITDQLNPSLRVRVEPDMQVWKQAELQAINVYRPRREALMLVYRQVMKDNYLNGAINTLKNKVLSEAFAVVDASGKESPDVLKKFQRPWFFEFLNRVLDTDFWGHTLINFDYPATEGEFQGEFVRLDIVPRAHVVPERGEVLLNPNDAVGLQFRGVEADYTALLLEVALKDEEGNYSLGILNKAVPHVIWKRFSMADWSRRSEKYGMPLLALKTDAVDETELRNKEAALANMGSNGWALLDTAEEIEIKESSNQDGSKMYKALADFQNNELAYLISGQTMTSQDGASKSQGEVHERVQEHYVQARMRFLYFFVNFELFPFLKRWGYELEGLTWKWRGMMAEEQGRLNPAPKPGADPTKDTPPPPNARKKPAAKKQLAANFNTPVAAGPVAAGLTLAAGPTLTGLFNEVVTKLHAQRPELKKMLRSKQWQALFRQTAKQLTAAAEEGYGYKLADLAGGSPDAALLSQFADNLYIFSAAKDYRLLVELNALLVDEAGNVRPFGDFKKQALALHDTYNTVWLQTEYNTAVATAQMARKWQGFQEGDVAKYFLKYSTVNDERVRPEHAALDGITLPVTDAFWNTHTPPLGWHCRCTLVRVPRAGRTATSQKELDNVESAAPGFGHNAAKTGVIFPDSHTFANVPDDAKPLLRNIGLKARQADK